MMHIRSEGGVVRQGFNFYPLTDKGSFGFIYRSGNTATTVRFSKILKKFICQKHSIT
jgi:hypothetical protein